MTAVLLQGALRWNDRGHSGPIMGHYDNRRTVIPFRRSRRSPLAREGPLGGTIELAND
jgi:hypothetical protein